MKIKYKKLAPNAVVPTKGTPNDAGYDLTATSKRYRKAGRIVEYGTGISVEIPVGYVGLLFPRSSVTNKQLMLANSVGVIDPPYRGELRLRFRVMDWLQLTLNFAKKIFKRKLSTVNYDSQYSIGDRVGQLVVVKGEDLEFEESSYLSETQRGEGGFGSTGE